MSLSLTDASEVGLLAPYRGGVVLEYAKTSRRNLDNWTECAYGCLESRRPIYQNLQRRLIASPVLLPRWVGYFPEVNRSGPRGIPARFWLFQLHRTRRLLMTIHHTSPPHSGTSQLLRFRDESFITSWGAGYIQGGGGSEFFFVMYWGGGGLKRK